MHDFFNNEIYCIAIQPVFSTFSRNLTKLLLYIGKSDNGQTIVFLNYSSIYWANHRHHRPGNRLGCLSSDDVIIITTT